MTFFGSMFGYDSRGRDLLGCNRDATYNCGACGLSCDAHSPAQEAACLYRIFGGRGTSESSIQEQTPTEQTSSKEPNQKPGHGVTEEA